jgi:hypothetical protein
VVGKTSWTTRSAPRSKRAAQLPSSTSGARREKIGLYVGLGTIAALILCRLGLAIYALL